MLADLGASPGLAVTHRTTEMRCVFDSMNAFPTRDAMPPSRKPREGWHLAQPEARWGSRSAHDSANRPSPAAFTSGAPRCDASWQLRPHRNSEIAPTPTLLLSLAENSRLIVHRRKFRLKQLARIGCWHTPEGPSFPRMRECRILQSIWHVLVR